MNGWKRSDRIGRPEAAKFDILYLFGHKFYLFYFGEDENHRESTKYESFVLLQVNVGQQVLRRRRIFEPI